MALRDQAGSRQQGFGKSDHKWAERASQHQGSLENHVFVISRICCWHTRNPSHGSPMAKLRIACVYGVQRTVVCMIDCMYFLLRTFQCFVASAKSLVQDLLGVSFFARPLQNRVIVGSLAQRVKSLEQLVRGLPGDAWTGIGNWTAGVSLSPLCRSTRRNSRLTGAVDCPVLRCFARLHVTTWVCTRTAATWMGWLGGTKKPPWCQWAEGQHVCTICFS